MASLSSYLQKTRAAFSRESGAQVAALLDVTQCYGAAATGGTALSGIKDLKSLSEKQVENQCRKALGSVSNAESITQVVSACLVCAKHLRAKRPVDAYDRLVSSVQAFVDLFRAEEEAWVVEPLHAIVANVRVVAGWADDLVIASGGKPAKLENAGNHLMTCFSAANRPQGDPNKRLATLRIINSLFRIYFRLNTLRNCKYLVRVVDAKKFVSFDLFQSSDRVTYKYFVGRLAVYDENYEDAVKDLTYAFDRCLPSHYKQRKKILEYLVPVKIYAQNHLPTDNLLKRYGLETWFSEIKVGIKTGSVSVFEKALGEKMEVFVNAGIFLLMEKLRTQVYRRLLRRVKLLHGEMKPEKAAQVPLRLFVKALEREGYPADLDEVECIVANQIFDGHVKGYISHKSGVVVLSKKDPFPAMAIT